MKNQFGTFLYNFLHSEHILSLNKTNCLNRFLINKHVFDLKIFLSRNKYTNTDYGCRKSLSKEMLLNAAPFTQGKGILVE